MPPPFGQQRGCEVWCPTQNGEAALAATAEASGHPIEKCAVNKLHLGGGFGRARGWRLCDASHHHRQRDAGYAGEAVVDT